jgi:GT2 family glycosyltransferase
MNAASAVIPASVIVVSRHRAEALQRCLKALTLQDHPDFEVIVVADPAGIAAARAMGLILRLALFDDPNISAARNIGLSLAAGEVVAFIDDDAVAEPTWLKRLCAPFGDASVVASTGFVRGRNGISYQWKAAEVDRFGQDHPFEVADGGEVWAGTAERAVKTQGTNCAFRAKTLRGIGGFDSAYRFFLDEADVNLRLAALGRTAVVPLAEVQHGFAASAQRRHDRVPLDLTEIAASTAVFLRRHAPEADPAPHWDRLRSEQLHRLQAHRRAGRLTAAEETALLRSLETGWAAGLTRILAPLPPLASAAPDDFTPLPGTGPKPGLVLSGPHWRRGRLRAVALEVARRGQIVTVFCFSLTARAHRNHFDPGGFWWQEGGLFGRSDRETNRFRLCSLAGRVRTEINRLRRVRPCE